MLYFDRTGGRSLGQTRMARTRPRGGFDIPWQTGQSTKPNLHPALFSTLRIQPSTQSTTNSIKHGHSFWIKKIIKINLHSKWKHSSRLQKPITVATSIFYTDRNKDSPPSVWAPYGGKGVPDSDIDWDDVCSALNGNPVSMLWIMGNKNAPFLCGHDENVLFMKHKKQKNKTSFIYTSVVLRLFQKQGQFHILPVPPLQKRSSCIILLLHHLCFTGF